MKLSCILSILFLITAAAVAIPNSEVHRVTFAIAVYHPFVIEERDGHLKGIYQDYVTELIQKAGLEPHFETMPLPRVLHNATKGTYDFFIGISGTPEADEKYTEVARFHKLKLTLFGLVKKIDFSQGPIIVGKAPQTECPLFTKEQEKHVHFFEYTSMNQALRMLVAKRITVLCTTKEVFYFELQTSEYTNLTFNELNEFKHEYSISLYAHKRISPEKIKNMNKVASELEQKNSLPNLYKKYGLSDAIRTN